MKSRWIHLSETSQSGNSLHLCTCCGRVTPFPDTECPLMNTCAYGTPPDRRDFPLRLDGPQFEAVQQALCQYVENCDVPHKDAPLLLHASRILDRMKAVSASSAEEPEQPLLDRLIQLQKQSPRKALSAIYDALDEMVFADNFAQVDALFSALDVNQFEPVCLIGFLGITAPARGLLDNWGMFLQRSRQSCLERGMDPEKVARLFDRFGTGK